MSKLDNLIIFIEPPENRSGMAEGGKEKHFTEAAVMLAYGMHLFDKYLGLNEIEIHPDGEHGKRFDIRKWLECHGYQLIETQGKTTYGGKYTNGDRSVVVSPKSGMGDVVARVQDQKIVAECKGGIINTRHPGQKSRLRRGLCEAIGLLMSRNISGEMQYAVVPFSDETERLTKLLRPRCAGAGIGIALVREDGTLIE